MSKETLFLSTNIDLKTNILLFQIGRKTICLAKGLYRYIFMDMKLGHASIIDKKNQFFIASCDSDIEFILCCVTFGVPCIIDSRSFSIMKQKNTDDKSFQ
jgi:hypothetical protein